MAGKRSAFDQEMMTLDAELKRLEAEYTMFFAGRLPRLPWETRARVDALIKHYDRMALRNTAERFRFSTLQARYAKFCDLWERHLRAKEEGRVQRPARKRPESAIAPVEETRRKAAPTESAPTSDAPVVKPSRAKGAEQTVIRDSKTEPARLKELYERLSAARKVAGEAALPYERFTQVVDAQIKKLGGGADDVTFGLAVRQGKVTLTAEKKEKKE